MIESENREFAADGAGWPVRVPDWIRGTNSIALAVAYGIASANTRLSPRSKLGRIVVDGFEKARNGSAHAKDRHAKNKAARASRRRNR
jgi:hypothetical protein